MKVLHILNTSSYSGAENVAITIINEMKKKNIESVYLSLEGPIKEVLATQKIQYYPVVKLSKHNISKEYF